MRKNLLFIVLFTLFVSVVGCTHSNTSITQNENIFIDEVLEENSPENLSKISRVIKSSYSETFLDKTSENSKRNITIDLSKSPKVIKDEHLGDKGKLFYQYLWKDKSVDISVSMNGKEIKSSKNNPIDETMVNNILSYFSLTGNKSDYSYVGKEKLGNLSTVKIKEKKKTPVDDILELMDEKTREREDVKKAINNIKEGIDTFYWVDKNSHKVVKIETNTTDKRKILYYTENPNGKNPPIVSKMLVTIDYSQKNIRNNY